MASQDMRFQTILIFMIIVTIVLVSTIVLISNQPPEIQIFVISLNTMLIVMNLIGFFWLIRSSSTVIDEVFVITPSGMLLKHYSRRLKPYQDEDIIASMLTAVQNFVRDSFDTSGGRLNEIKFENYDIMLSYSKNLVLAAVISTKNPQRLRDALSDAANEIETAYGDKLSEWNGDLGELRHIDSVMKKLLGRI